MNIHHRCHDVTVAASEILPSAIEIVTELSLLKGNSWSIPTARVLSIPHYILKGSLVDPRLRTSNDIDDPSKLAYLSFTGGWPVWPPTARGFHTRPPTGTPRRAINPASTFPSCAFREHRRPTDTHIPSLSSNPPSPLRGVAEAALYCAHRTIYMLPPSSLVFPLLEGHSCWSKCGRRTRPFSGRAFREHRTNVGALPPFSPLTDPPPPVYDSRYLTQP